MVAQYKKVHDILVEAFGKFYNGKDIDFQQVCLNCKDLLEKDSLLGQNIEAYPPTYNEMSETPKSGPKKKPLSSTS